VNEGLREALARVVVGNTPGAQLAAPQVAEAARIRQEAVGRRRDFIELSGPLPEWTNAFLLNSWANAGAPYPAASYYRDRVGRVHLRGVVGGGALGTSALTLITRHRPEAREPFGTSSGAGAAQVDVLPDGSVIVVAGGTALVSLSGISFRAFS
jgi:hypothetical protein